MVVTMAIGGVPHVGVWVLERCSDPKFPFRLRIYRGERPEPVLSFLVRDRWPGANQHIFCLREQRAPAPLEIGDEVERVPVVALHRYGKRLTVILDRARQKRCDFQIVEKAYKVSRAWRTDDVRADLLVHPDVDAAAAPTRRAAPLELGAGRGAGADRERRAVPVVVWGPEHRARATPGRRLCADGRRRARGSGRAQDTRGAARRLQPDGRPTPATAGVDGFRTACPGHRSALRGSVES